MTADPSNQFPDVDQRGRAAALAMRESVAYTSLVPIDPRLTGRRNPRRWALGGALALASVAVIGAFVVMRSPDRESQGTASSPIATGHFAPGVIPAGLVVYAADSSINHAADPSDPVEPFERLATVYERADGVLFAFVVSNVEVLPDDGATTAPGPLIHGNPSTWTKELSMPFRTLSWQEGDQWVMALAARASESDVHAVAAASDVTHDGATVISDGLTLRYGPGEVPFFNSRAFTGAMNPNETFVRLAQPQTTNAAGDPSLVFGRVTDMPGAEYYFKLLADDPTPGSFAGRLVWHLSLFAPDVYNVVVWVEEGALFLAASNLDDATTEAVLASLGPVGEATWQMMLQRTEDLPDGLSVDEG